MRPSPSSLRVSSRVAVTRRQPTPQRRWIVSTFRRQTEQPLAPETQTPQANVQSKGKEKEALHTTDESKAEQKDVLPLLQRPLGVREKPEARIRSWADTKEKFLDQEKRLEERTHLAREATRGYFFDLNATRRHGGKTWVAPMVMIREDRALYFPDIHGTPLAGEGKVHTTNILQGKVSIVTLLTTRISELQTAQFVGPTQEAFASNPLFQMVQVNLQDNLIKSFLVSLFASGIRKQVPEPLWPTYLISNQNMEYLRQPLGIANKHVGYVYLVDPNLKIRWGGCADPKAEEIDALKACTTVLLNRIAKEQASSSQTSQSPQEES